VQAQGITEGLLRPDVPTVHTNMQRLRRANLEPVLFPYHIFMSPVNLENTDFQTNSFSRRGHRGSSRGFRRDTEASTILSQEDGKLS